MKIKLTIALIAGVITLTFNAAKAQTAATTPPSAATIKAAEDMLAASAGAEQFEKTINSTMAQMSTAIPEDKRTKFMEVMKTFISKYCNWDSIKGDMAAIYAREFTEAELKQLAVFYKSPLGKKLNEKLPMIMSASSNIGQKIVMEHQTELQQMLMDAMK